MKGFKFTSNNDSSIYDLTPLLDIIFIIIIFIFISANFTKIVNISIPILSKGNSTTNKITKKIEFAIDKNGIIKFQKTKIDSITFLSILNANRKKKIILYTDKSIHLQNLIDIISILKNENISNYYIACEKNQ